jgi:hypothetical protein
LDSTDLDNRFTYHAPKADQPVKYQEIRSCARDMADIIDDLAPDSREKSLAITKLEELVFWANAAIARHG